MKAIIQDAGTLSALQPLEVASYLRTSGWTKLSGSQGRWTTWIQKQNGDEFEVVLPLSREFRDYALRMSDVLQVLEASEHRSQLDILRDLLVTSADVVRVTVKDAELADGTVSLEEGAKLFENAKQMMLAAACSALGPRGYFPSRRPAEAMAYVSKTRFGQTVQGSFGLTIISRVPPGLSGHQSSRLDSETPYERRVTFVLANSLHAVLQATTMAALGGDVNEFVSGIGKGISANLCDAIVGMADSGEKSRSLHIQLSWSRSRPVAPDNNIPTEVNFAPDMIPVIREAASFLKHHRPIESYEAIGPVVKLERDSGASAGRIALVSIVDEQPRKITVELSGHEYAQAVEAHRTGSHVRCAGTLTREGRTFRLTNPVGFTVHSNHP